MRLPLLVMTLLLAGPAAAEEPAAALPPEVEDAAALVRRMEERLRALDDAARERDRALQFLEQQVEAARSAIDGGQEAEAALREGAAALSTRLDAVAAERERLNESLTSGAVTIESLSRQVAALNATLSEERATAAERLAALEADNRSRGAEIERLRGQLSALDATLSEERKAAAERLAAVQADADLRGQELARLREQIAALDVALGEARAASEASQAQLKELAAARDEASGLAAARAEEIRVLTQEVAGLRDELARTRALLGDEQAKGAARADEIAQLNARLKEALQSRIEELERYRSEFFGRLREALGERPDIRIVGDRFVFQSEVLFASGSAELGPDGQAQLRALARSLREVAASIPDDVSWILRVDGHTDRVPIRGAPFRNNWQLSVERALAVVEFLEREGIPSSRLAATGFGEWQPLDPTDDEIAYRRNRRIEFKLTER
jgi:chemotaxis protein MotB